MNGYVSQFKSSQQMPSGCTIVLGYCLNYRDNIKQLKALGLKFKKYEGETTFHDDIVVIRDAENNYLYIPFWHEYTECSYCTFPIELDELSKFREKIETLIMEGILPANAQFGVHTFY